MGQSLMRREIDRQHRVVLLTVSGELEDDALLRMVDELASAREITPDWSLLIDLRGAVGSKVSPVGVRRLVEQPLVLAPRSRRAVVVPTNLGFGMARMYEMLRGDHGGAVRAFRDYEEARRWVSQRGPASV